MSILELQEDQQPPEMQRLIARMHQIQENLTVQTSLLHEALADIHKNLAQHEELTNFLSDDDIAKLHKAFEIHKQFALIQKEEKKVSGKGRKKLSDKDLSNL